MAAVFAGSMGAILGLAKSFSTSYWVYIVLEGLEAAIGDALSPMFMLSKNKFIFKQKTSQNRTFSVQVGIILKRCNQSAKE